MKKYILLFIMLLPFTAYADDTIAADPEIKLLLSHESLPYPEGDFLVLPPLGLFMQNDHEFTSLDRERCTEFRSFRLKNRYRCDNLFTYNDEFLMQSDDLLLHLDGDSTNIIFRLEDDNFTAYPGKDGLFSVVSASVVENPISELDSIEYLWSVYNCVNDELVVQQAFHEPVTDVIAVSKDDYFLVLANSILRCTPDGTFLMAQSEKPIHSAAMTDSDLYFCTDETLYQVCDDGISYPVLSGKFHAIFADNSRMYLIMENGDIYTLNL